MEPSVDFVRHYENAECRRDRVGLKPVVDMSMEACGKEHFLGMFYGLGEVKVGAS